MPNLLVDAIDWQGLSSEPLAEASIPLLEEWNRRESHLSRTYEPDDNPKRNQLGFHRSPAKTRLLLGGTNSGKSMAAAMEAKYWLCEDHPYQDTPPAPQIYVISAEYLTAEQGIWRNLRECLPEWEIERMGQNVGDRMLPAWVKVKKGGCLWFISAEAPEEARKKIQAAQLDLLIYDEEVSSLLWEEGGSRRLRKGGRAIVSACPIRGEPWIIQLENAALAGAEEIHLWRFDTKRALEAGHCDPKVFAEMDATLTEEQKASRFHGKTNQSIGLVYPEFKARDDDNSPWHVIDPFEIPKDWTRFCAIDPGIQTFAVLWAAVAPDHHVYFYDCLYEHRKHVVTAGELMLTKEKWKYHGATGHFISDDNTDEINTRWIDPSSFRMTETGADGVADILMRAPEQGGLQLDLVPARNRIEAGIELVRQGLMPMIDGLPRFRFFRTLQPLFAELGKLRWQKDSGDYMKSAKRPAPISRDDHLCDCLRYLASGGLSYEPPLDDRIRQLKRLRSFRPPPLVGATIQMEERHQRLWRRMVERQIHGQPQGAHLGGLGSDY